MQVYETMFEIETMGKTKDFCCRYLSPLSAGPWNINGACISARTETSYLVTSDSQTVRILIEKPQEWAVAFEIAQRSGNIERVRPEAIGGGADGCGSGEVQRRYLRWLDSL